MKIVTWNINGIRAPPRELKGLLDEFDADVICLQETKVTREMLDVNIAIVEGYNSYFSYSRKRSGYSGVVTYCKESARPVAAEEGISGYWSSQCNPKQLDDVGHYGYLAEMPMNELLELDAEGRAVITEHRFIDENGDKNSMCVINVYCPRADKEREDRKAYKLKFCQLMQVRAEALVAAGRQVVIVGDLNTSHRSIDTCDSSDTEYMTNPCRIWLNDFISDLRVHGSGGEKSTGHSFVDSFRYFNPEAKEGFTCWSTATGARKTNYGCRIDYILGDNGLVQNRFRSCKILPDVHGSDHCPVVAELDLIVLAADKCPSLCTKWMPEFSGKQRKMHDFFKKRSDDQSEVVTKKVLDSLEVEFVGLKAPQKKLRLSDSAQSVVTKKPKNSAKTAAGQNVQLSLTRFFRKITPAGQSILEPAANETALLPLSQEIVELQSDSNEFRSLGAQASILQSQPNSLPISSGSVDQWRKILRGPLPPPLCSHKEPAVLKIVKRSGPNHGRRFYMCAKPEGYQDDANARCKFFKWL